MSLGFVNMIESDQMSSACEMYNLAAQKYCTLEKCYSSCKMFDSDLGLIFQQFTAQKLKHKLKYMYK